MQRCNCMIVDTVECFWICGYVNLYFSRISLDFIAGITAALRVSSGPTIFLNSPQQSTCSHSAPFRCNCANALSILRHQQQQRDPENTILIRGEIAVKV